MTLLCCLWGFTHVFSKLAAGDISLVLQGGLRSIIAVPLVLAWMRWRGIPLFVRDGTLAAGLVAGALFAGEFLFIFAGLAHTGASRMVVFVYLAPCLTALALHWLVAARAADGRSVDRHLARVRGGGCGLRRRLRRRTARRCWAMPSAWLRRALWAATTVVIRTTKLASHQRVQDAASINSRCRQRTLPVASVLLGEPGVVAVTPLAVASLLYQGVIVTFASYLAWFWLLTRYLAARLSAFAFLTPLFGVVAGVVVLGEPLRPAFVGALALVGTGIYLVNRPSPKG